MSEQHLEADIKELLEKWSLAVARSDASAVGDLVTEDSEFWTHGADALIGRHAVVKAMTSFFSRYQFRQEFRCQEILVSGDLALVRGLEINHLTPLTSGDPITIEQRAFSVIVRGTDGKWRFARGMTNSPPKEKPAVRE
jgi:uncharacterized protein (TIGR02246 family)